MLFVDTDAWVHLVCAVWSAETFATECGSLVSLRSAITRGKMVCSSSSLHLWLISAGFGVIATAHTNILHCDWHDFEQMKCSMCDRRGATMGCRYRRCPQNYHYACAVKGNCIFRTSGHVFCEQHHEAGMADAKPFTDFTYPHHLGMCRGGGHIPFSSCAGNTRPILSLPFTSKGQFFLSVCEFPACTDLLCCPLVEFVVFDANGSSEEYTGWTVPWRHDVIRHVSIQALEVLTVPFCPP